MSDLNLEELIDRHLRGELDDSEKERLTELLDSDPSARKKFVEHAEWDTRFAEALREEHHDGGLPDILNRPIAERSTIFRLRTLLTLAATVIIALAAGLYFNQPPVELVELCNPFSEHVAPHPPPLPSNSGKMFVTALPVCSEVVS